MDRTSVPGDPGVSVVGAWRGQAGERPARSQRPGHIQRTWGSHLRLWAKRPRAVQPRYLPGYLPAYIIKPSLLARGRPGPPRVLSRARAGGQAGQHLVGDGIQHGRADLGPA